MSFDVRAEVMDFLDDAAIWESPAVVHTFSVYRRTPNNLNAQEVVLEVHDYGEGAGSHRFMVLARNVETGRTATGNPGSELRTVLSLVHWQELDRD